MKYLIIVGTAREGRNTVHAARTADQKFRENGHETFFYDLKEKDIPPLGNRRYVDSEEPVPDDIEDLGQKVEEADYIVLVTPEYNHSIPGTLKNAMDYLYPEYDDKPFSFITTSGGPFGGVRASLHLNDIVLELGGFPGPNLHVTNIGSKYEDGEIVDQEFEGRFDSFVEKTEKHSQKFK